MKKVPERIQRLLSLYNQGRRLEAVARIAEGPAPGEKTKEHKRYVEAVELTKLYYEVFALSTFQIILRLHELFDKTNEFHKAHPTAMKQQSR